MLRLLKQVAWIGMLVAGLPAAQAFSLYGPVGNGGDAWQVADLGFGPPFDIGAPKNIGEDYRRNMPILYYAFDETFLDYFGSNGVWAVDQAFAVLNNLPPVSSYSADLSEVPLEARRINQTAAALNLIDLKSVVLALMVKQLGLADPIRYTWVLHDRVAGADCPVGNQYLVTKRNLALLPSSLDQLQYSSYVNGVLFSYFIQDFCGAPPPGFPLSDAVEIPVDVPLNAARYIPLASFSLSSLAAGSLYTGLTRDDIAGLRYLVRSNHVHWEEVPANTAVLVPSNSPALLVTSNLMLLTAQSLTNDDAGLQALYPGLAIVPGSTITSFSNVATPTISSYYANYPWDVVGTPPHLVYTTNYTTNVMTIYSRSFANVVTNSYSPVSFMTIIETNRYFPPTAPSGYSQTNTSIRTFLTNIVSGDFYLMPTNLCGFEILSNVLSTAIALTNGDILTVTNVPTNAAGGTYLLSRSSVSWFTNHTLAYQAVQCVSNLPGLRRGIEKITFVKTAFDSMLGKFYAPQTATFTMTTVTNSTNWVQTYQRVATEPDFLFTAADMMPGPAAPVDSGSNILFGISFNEDNVLPGLAGPGIIEALGSNSPIVFNKSGPIYYNSVTNNGYFLDERTATRRVMWASYDESTNAPVVFPNGTSIESIESQMMMQVTSTTLPPGKVGMAYTTQLTGSGGSGPPFTWSLAPNSTAVPSGLVLTLDGRLSGTPTTSGISSFYVQMTDPNGRFTVWQVTLTVLP